MRTLRKVVGLAAAGLLLGVVSAGAGAAAEPAVPETPTVPDVPEPTTLNIPTVAEAWYQLTAVNTCGTPAGCLPASAESAAPKIPASVGGVAVPAASPFPADTLHVGFVGAVETARTYIKLDLSSLPDGAEVSEGALTLPVDTRPTAGTLKPEQAQMKACLALSGFHNQAGGSLATAPKMDCGVSSPLWYAGGKFSVDLGPFMEAWAGGAENFGIAITAFKVPDPTKPFQVAFPGSGATNLPHIGGLLRYDLLSAAAGDELTDAAAAATDTPAFTYVGPSTLSKSTLHRVTTPAGSAGAAPLTDTVATPVSPPSDWTLPILGALAALAAMGGVYELTRRRMRRFAF